MRIPAHVHFHFLGRQQHRHHPHASTTLGVLHGFAGGSHLLAVIPALALPPIGAVAYMGAYLVGSFVAMGLVVLAISIASSCSSYSKTDNTGPNISS